MPTLAEILNDNTPNRLYHGSGYEQTELKPGFQHSGKSVIWDQYESNSFLYASGGNEAARLLGLSSALEKKYKLDHTRFDEDTRTITLKFSGHVPTKGEIENIGVWVYTIGVKPGVWEKNRNPHNQIEDEWKTRQVIPSQDIVHCDKVDVRALLRKYRLTVS